MQVSALANKILKLSPSIRYVTVASLNGKILISAHKKTVKTTLSKSESRSSLQMAARGWKQRKALAKKLGRCKYVVAEYDRSKENYSTCRQKPSFVYYYVSYGKSQ